MREYYDRVKVLRNKDKFQIKPEYPINDLRIELSNVCNHQCIFCANRKMTRKKGHMEEAFLKRILKEAYQEGFRGVGYYSTGEPFVSPNLAEYVRWAKEIGYDYVYITTNGGAVEFDKIKEVIDAGLDSIKFSINGTNRENYILVHGRDDFDRVIQNLQCTYQYKKELNRNLNVFVSFAVTKYTEDSVEEFIQSYKEYADDIITANVIDMGGYVPEVNEYLLTKNQTDFSEGMTIPCYSLWNALIVTWEGYLTACCADFQNYFIYADLNQTTLKEAWHCEKITELRQKHLEGDIEGTPCVSCVSRYLGKWKPVSEEWATEFDEQKMFDTEDAQKRIQQYLDKKSRMEQFLSLLCNPKEVHNIAKEKLQIIKKESKIILFGAGLSGRTILDYLREQQIEPCAFCDNNPAKVGQILEGLSILSLEEVKKVYLDAYIIISCDAYREIMEQLCKEGFCREKICFFDPNWIRQPEGEKEYIYQHIYDLEESFHLLEDQKSKDVFVALLNYKMTHELKYIEEIADKNMYFDKELIHFRQDEVFLDVGAYTGDTLLEFLEACGRQYGKVICLEPNKENIHALKKVIEEQKLENVDIYPYGASDKKQVLRFSTDSNVAARISKEGTEQIACDTIDHLCLDQYNRIDFIKMDIEGSEYYALKGAKKVIETFHPKLAICVYHKKDDFYKLPLFMKKLYPKYKLYFRQYELSAEETVCYAIPEEDIL